MLLLLSLSFTPNRLKPASPPPRLLRVVACAAGPDPEEWRAFRAKLVSGGLKLTGEEDGGGEVESTPTEPAEPAERQSVAPKNEELLKLQNEALWRECVRGGRTRGHGGTLTHCREWTLQVLRRCVGA
jgi:hypothetical protein